MNLIKSTDFSFLGARDYIHSTSIIEFIHNNINSFISDSPVEYSLDIKMYKEVSTNCKVDIYNCYHEYIDKTVMCEIILKSNNDKRFVYFLSNHKVIIKKTITPIYHVEEIDLYGKFSGHYRIASNNYSEFIKNIIQSNKELHIKNLGLGEFKIINMFMKNVPVGLLKYINILDIEIKNIGIREISDGNLSTLSEIHMIEMNLKPILVGFKSIRLNT
jgi:hypothetical protein